MKKLHTIFILTILIFALAFNSLAQVNVITAVVEKKYSKGDSELKAVDLKLKIKFMNQSDVPILIYKGAFDVTHIWVGKNIEYLTTGSFEQSSILTVATAKLRNIKKMSIKDFIVLQKNGKYETNSTVRLFVPYNSSEKIDGAISKGNHALRLQFYNWNWSEEESKNRQIELEKYGKILMNSVISEPMSFNIE